MSDRRIQRNQNRHRRIVDRRKSAERSNQLRRRISARRPDQSFALNLSFPAAVQPSNRALVPVPVTPRFPSSRAASRPSPDESLRFWLARRISHRSFAAIATPHHFRHHLRLIQCSAVGDRRNRRHQLHRRHAHFLPHRNRTNRNRAPVVQFPADSFAFTRQIHAGLLAKSEHANVFVKLRSAESAAPS